MIIGITGTDGAGKGMAVEYLVASKGFVHCSARAIWEEEFAKRGIENKRENMRLVANELRALHGNDFLVTYYLKKIEAEHIKNAIIESIRTIDEAKTLHSNDGVLIAIDADVTVRYERIKNRGLATDTVSYEEFVVQEALEMNDPNPHGMQKAKVMEMADYTITNNTSPEDLHAQVDVVLEQLAHNNTH